MRLTLQAPAKVEHRRFEQIALGRNRLLLDDDGAAAARRRLRRRRGRERPQRFEQAVEVEGLDQEPLRAGLRDLVGLLRVALKDAAHQDDAGIGAL